MAVSKSDVEDFAIGVGAYYLFYFLLAFYPATIMAIHFTDMANDEVFGGLIAFGITFGVIWLLDAIYKVSGNIIPLLLLIGIYLFYLWPFIQLLKILWNDFDPNVPFPAFDWWFFW